MSTLEPNGEIGDYRVESVVRSGTGGAVYRAEQSSLRRTVALYVPAASAQPSAAATQFAEDARLLAGLDHPNLLPVYQVDLADNRPFATVRDIGGRRLEDLLREGPLDPRRAVSIGEQVAGALEGLEAADVAPADLTKSVIVVDKDGSLHAYLSPLDAIVDARPDTPLLHRNIERASHPSAAALAHMLTTMVTGSGSDGASRARLPAPLRGVIERALARDDDPPSPSELMRAARRAVGTTTVSAPRSGRATVLALGVLLLIAAVLVAVVLIQDGGESSRVANAPVARVEATIPLHATPGSLAVGDDVVWVATTEGTVLRIDPRSNEVVGAPIRFMPPREEENVTVRVGDGAVWVLDGSGGMLSRIDPRSARVTGRLRIGGILHGAQVAEGSVWISRSPPGAGTRQRGELVRVDTERFRLVGAPIAIGPAAFDVEVADGVIWTMNAGDGTMTRVEADTGKTRTFRPSSQPVDAAMHEATLWIPDPFDGTVTPLDTRRLQLPDKVIRGGHPVSAVATRDAVWFVAEADVGGGPARLYRIDPRARALVGRPVELGPAVGWLNAGDDVVWVRSMSKRAVLKVVPTTPTPEPSPAQPPAGDPRELISGPLPPGPWRVAAFAVPLRLALTERGWVSSDPTREFIGLGRFEDPDATLAVYVPRQLFAPGGGVRRLETPAQLLEALTSNPNIRLIARDRWRVGGELGERVTLSVRPHTGFPDFCSTPCVPLVPLPEGLTMTVDADVKNRLWIGSHAGRVVVIQETEAKSARGFAATTIVLRRLRFERSG